MATWAVNSKIIRNGARFDLMQGVHGEKTEEERLVSIWVMRVGFSVCVMCVENDRAVLLLG